MQDPNAEMDALLREVHHGMVVRALAIVRDPEADADALREVRMFLKENGITLKGKANDPFSNFVNRTRSGSSHSETLPTEPEVEEDPYEGMN